MADMMLRWPYPVNERNLDPVPDDLQNITWCTETFPCLDVEP